jgi:hypothetical protein
MRLTYTTKPKNDFFTHIDKKFGCYGKAYVMAAIFGDPAIKYGCRCSQWYFNGKALRSLWRKCR